MVQELISEKKWLSAVGVQVNYYAGAPDGKHTLMSLSEAKVGLLLNVQRRSTRFQQEVEKKTWLSQQLSIISGYSS